MKRILLLLLMFVAISVPSFATNWKYLSTDGQGTIIYRDKDSICYYKGAADVWAKRIEKSGAHTVTLLRITTDKRYRILSFTDYDKYGDVIKSQDVVYDTFTRIPPDSIAEDLYVALYYS